MFHHLLYLCVIFKFVYCGDADVNKANFKDVIFTYPTGVRSERDIPVCPTTNIPHAPQSPKIPAGPLNIHESAEDVTEEEVKMIFDGETACNMIHKRYFFSPVVERLCRCPDRSECPWHWSQGPSYPNTSSKAQQNRQEKQQQPTKTNVNSPMGKAENASTGGSVSGGGGGGKRDPHTIMINNRSQLKFCNDVTNLERCKGKKPSLYRVLRNSSSSSSPEGQITLTNVTCYCPPLYRHWVFVDEEKQDFLNGTSIKTLMYRCDKLARCASLDKCGNIRSDYHSTFYHCSCPSNHLCLPKEDEEEIEVDEIFYKGPAYQAYCTPS